MSEIIQETTKLMQTLNELPQETSKSVQALNELFLRKRLREKIFSFYIKPATRVLYYKEAALYDVYRCLTNPNVAGRETAILRSLTDKTQRAEFKRNNFPYCTFSGRFGETRKNDALQQHSSLMCLDFDHLSDPDAVKRILLADAELITLLLFVSPSGNGLKWVVYIDLEQADHLVWFEAIKNYLSATYQLEVDPACKNVARACFVPYDPKAYIAPELLPEMQPMLQVNPALDEMMDIVKPINITVKNER